MSWRIQIHHDRVEALLRSPQGPVFRKIADLTRQVENGAVARAPVDDGRLRASISSTVTVRGTRIVGRIGSPLPYAIYVHEGTGIYGPKGRPIRPVHGKWLVFEPGRSMGPLRRGGKHPPKGKRGGPVFAKEVKGSPPRPFLYDALVAVVPWPVRRTR